MANARTRTMLGANAQQVTLAVTQGGWPPYKQNAAQQKVLVRTRNFSPRGPNLPRKGEKEDPAHYEKNKKPINRVIAFVPRGREDDVLSSLQDTVVDHEAKWLGRDAGAQGARATYRYRCTRPVRLWGSYRSTELLFPFSSSQVYT